MNTDRTPEEFFTDLLALTEQQFRLSPVYQKQLKHGKLWNYAVCATPIANGKGIIFGINWGGNDGYKPQTIMPTGEDVAEYTFLNRNLKYLKNMGLNFSEINFNYTNLCFFRSPRVSLIENEDFALSLIPFEKYVRYIDPPWMLSLGIKNMQILNRFGLLKNIKRYHDDQKKFSGISAQLWDRKVFAVPHPNAHVPRESRATIWEKVINEINV